jgi:nucleotide-binding universal stress UspA family protein
MPNTNKKFAVAFSSPKRSAKTIELASAHAKAMDAELVLLRIIPDPNKVGVIAQLISTERPIDKAKMQIDEVVERLKQEGVKASGMVKVGEVAKGIVETTKEIGADVLYVGTTSIGGRQFFLMKNDPIVHYLVEHCPVSLFLVRHDLGNEQSVEQGEEEELNQ